MCNDRQTYYSRKLTLCLVLVSAQQTQSPAGLDIRTPGRERGEPRSHDDVFVACIYSPGGCTTSRAYVYHAISH